MTSRPALACLLALTAAPAVADGPPPPAPAPAAPASPGGKVPVEQFFKGRITKLDGLTIEIAYDFENPAQLDDFELSIPFRAIKTVARAIENGAVRITGTGSLRHKALFGKTAGASATLTPNKNHDFGFAVTEERESEVFTLYCLYDRYFGAGDNVKVPQNMIIKFIPRDPKSKDGRQDWRYCGSRGQKPEIERGQPYKVEIERGDNQSRLVINDWESKGKEAARDLTSQAVALYAYDGDFKADDLVVRGTLDAGWVERNHLDLTTWKPSAPDANAAGAAKPAAPGIAPDAAARVRAKIAGWPSDTKPAEMAALLRDANVPEALRTEAAQKAADSGEKKLVPYLVDGLYADDEVSRRLSGDVLAKLAGKSFGYRAEAPEDQRKKAIQSINDYLKKHSADFQ
jgi:hypothetical protein